MRASCACWAFRRWLQGFWIQERGSMERDWPSWLRLARALSAVQCQLLRGSSCAHHFLKLCEQCFRFLGNVLRVRAACSRVLDRPLRILPLRELGFCNLNSA